MVKFFSQSIQAYTPTSVPINLFEHCALPASMGSNTDSAATPLKVIIVGAGLGGLSCGIACRRQGFDVIIYDQVKEFLRIGDSIGLGSNTSRLLHRWGVAKTMETISSATGHMEIYNFDDSNTCLGQDKHISEIEKATGYRALVGHRGDFHLILYDFCLKLGVRILRGSKVVGYDTAAPSVTLATGETETADVVICADGGKSEARQRALGVESVPLASGYAIYRGFMNADLIRDDPIAGKFTAPDDRIRLFLAPDMHGFISTMRGGREINAVLTHKDTEDIDEEWAKEGNKEQILALLEGWDPAFRRVWEMFPSCLDWKLVYRPCLDKWVADSGRVALMGDACHPFLPTSVQGASQAIEDGATIAKCLAKIVGADGSVNRADIPVAMHTYFALRHEYVAAAQRTGIEQRDVWHNVHDKDSKVFKDNFDINKMFLSNTHLWENDAEKVVDDQWDTVSAQVRKTLAEQAAAAA
ncbi:hypothetical protein SBRCBS47491_004737 [Sporothrix bragantina]|uniref:FAD-binding domain-containing protein n=1 Tax=Sporothrix bragantina TaxID=671064 RepID=A0ABP0BSH4_9PEZI